MCNSSRAAATRVSLSLLDSPPATAAAAAAAAVSDHERKQGKSRHHQCYAHHHRQQKQHAHPRRCPIRLRVHEQRDQPHRASKVNSPTTAHRPSVAHPHLRRPSCLQARTPFLTSPPILPIPLLLLLLLCCLHPISTTATSNGTSQAIGTTGFPGTNSTRDTGLSVGVFQEEEHTPPFVYFAIGAASFILFVAVVAIVVMVRNNQSTRRATRAHHELRQLRAQRQRQQQQQQQHHHQHQQQQRGEGRHPLAGEQQHWINAFNTHSDANEVVLEEGRKAATMHALLGTAPVTGMDTGTTASMRSALLMQHELQRPPKRLNDSRRRRTREHTRGDRQCHDAMQQQRQQPCDYHPDTSTPTLLPPPHAARIFSDATNDVLLPSFTACADPSPADDEGDQERCLQARNAKRRVSEAPTAFTCVTNASRHSSDTSVFTKLPKLSLSGNDDSSQSQSPSRSQSYSQSTSMYGGSNDPAVLTQFVRTEQWMMAPLPESTPPSSPKHSSDNTRRNDDDRHDECGRRERNNNRREPTAVSAAVTSPGIAPPSYNQPAVTYESLRASLRRTGDHRDGDDDDDNGSDGMHVADAYDEPVDAACNNSPLHTHPAPPLPALPDMLLPTREQKSDGGHATAAPPSTAQQRRLVRSAATNDLSCLQATPTAAASVHMEGGEHAAIQHRIAAAEASESESSLASSSLSSLPPWSSIILAVPPLLQWQQQQQKEEEQQVHQQEQRDGWVTSAHTVVAGADDFEHDDDHVDGDSGGAGGGIRAGFEEQVQQTRRTLRFQPVSDKQGVQPPQPPRASAEASHASAGIIQADIVNDSSSNGAVHDSSSSPRQHQHQQPCQSLHHHSHGYSHDHDHDHNQQHRQHSRPIEHVIGERLAHVRPAVRANLSTLALAIQRHTATRTCSPATPTATGRQSTTTTTTPARKTPAVTNATSPPPPPHVQLSQFSPSPCNMRGTPATDNTSVSRVCAYAPSPNDIGGFGRTLSTPPTHNQRPTTLDPIAEDTPIDGRSLMHCKPKFAAFPDMRELMMQQDRPRHHTSRVSSVARVYGVSGWRKWPDNNNNNSSSNNNAQDAHVAARNDAHTAADAQFVPFRYRMQKLERQHARRGVPGVQTWCALFEKVYKWADGVASAMVAGHSDGISGATNLADEHVVTVENNENACEPEVLSGASEGVELGLNVHGGVSGNAQPRQRPAQPVAL